MPEAAVDEDDGAVLGEDYVRGTWEALDVDPVAETKTPEGIAQLQLRLCGSGVDLRHDVVPPCF